MDLRERLAAHLRSYLGAWPPPPGQVMVVGSVRREEPGWDGRVRALAGVVRDDGSGVVSVARAAAPRVGEALGTGPLLVGENGDDGARAALGGRLLWGVFRWSEEPADLPDAGQWVSRDDPHVPAWLRPFNGDVLVAWDEDGGYGAGVGRKRHDRWGQELAVATEERLRGKGLGRALVAQAARRVLSEGAVPTYLHDPENTASAHVARAAGFPDRGWHILGLRRDEGQGGDGRDSPDEP